ncbi:glycine betaine/L-proline ABC transporter substrate-binding protein ProX [Gracilimonas sp.]|uniref:glycine betaine/L-proline ABC transporter substrate-binding protein ProX n=1 Tax=Gracilimonas sp. TaxID=1974203 RepID=UPI002872A3C2|nr:glycine betaine/L-proline ABC transporter substrate-binding protein ProX [Gracilimonas sp.]
MKYLFKIFGLLLCAFLVQSDINAQAVQQPDSNEDTIYIARSTWDTGWFQTEVFRLLIEEMGYTVAPAETMTADEFYKALANGNMDLWVNGWFPLHEPVIQRYNQNKNIIPVGYEVESGALQGYLVDAVSAQRYNLQSLDQLQDPAVAEHFDTDGNGKADLIGCNTDWSCHDRIDEHLQALELTETVEQISGDYNPLAREAIEALGRDQPLLLYTWTPNWTLGQITPGEDVFWLHVPVEDQEAISGLAGSTKDEIKLGYDLNDIRVVSNRMFLNKYPDLRILFEELQIPLADIQEQNARMAGGEGSLSDIRNHAREWIADNKSRVTDILMEAGVENPFSEGTPSGSSPHSELQVGSDYADQTIRVVTQQVEPLVSYQNREYSGFSIEVFDAVAEEIGIDYTIYSVNSIAKMLDDLKRGEADIATAALGITSDREENLDFSHPYYETGLQIMIPKKESTISTIPRAILSIIFSKEVLFIFLFFFGVLLMSAHIIWFTERKENEDFPENYWTGIGVAIWWAAVTVTTVGYGDKTPKGVPGRVFGLIWIFAGYFAFSYFTATVTSTVTLQEIESSITNMDDLYGKEVATVSNSAAEFYLEDNGLNANTFNTIDEAIAQLMEGETDAVVYDAPVLQHFASQEGYGEVDVTGSIFQQQSYGFAMPKGSGLRKDINLGYLKLVEDGTYRQIQNRWFGN